MLSASSLCVAIGGATGASMLLMEVAGAARWSRRYGADADECRQNYSLAEWHRRGSGVALAVARTRG